MRIALLGAAVSAAFMLNSTQVAAATVIFDDFTTNQIAVDLPFGGDSNVSVIAFGAGTRTLTAENFTNNGNPNAATSLEAVGGALSFSNNDQATGRGTLTYTNVGDIANVDNPFFFFEVGTFDNVANFNASVTDGSCGMSTYFELLSPTFNPTLFFSQFVGTADFNDVATLTFSIDTLGGPDAVDGSLRSIQISAIPLPASGLLLLSGFGALAAVRRKKN